MPKAIEKRRQKGFEILEHDADVRLKVTGEDLETLFSNAVFGLFHILFDELPEKSEKSKKYSLSAANLEDLLVSWINEHLFYLEVEKFVPSRIFVMHAGENRLFTKCFGGTLREDQDILQTEVKAATRHGLSVTQDDEIWSATILIDI